MEKFKKILKWLLLPPGWFCVLFSFVAISLIALTVVLLVLGLTNNILGYVLYGVSAIVLSYFVYIIVLVAPKIKQGIITQLKKHKFTNELLESYGYRSVIFATFSFFVNASYAVVQGVVALLGRSIWFGALAGYYLVISLIRGGLVIASRKTNGGKQLEKQIKSYRNCGIYMLILNFALVPAIVQMVIKNEGFKYAGVMIYVMAAYAFYKLGISIYNLFKVKKQSNFVIAAIKNISFADALVSILALQTALLQTFLQEGSPRLFNALTGGMVSIGVISIGIYMIVNATCKLNKIVEKNKDVEV